MSKLKYFTKYLPVEGEIKVGDRFFSKGKLTPVWDNEADMTYINEKLYTQKAKLFLCSRDIQVGDHYYNPTVSLELTDECDSEIRLEQIQEQEKLFNHGRFKVIGEISPQATWVTEGMEIDEYEMIHFKRVENTSWVDYGQVCQIKCPTCKNFH